jgi:hypothetical protein
MGGACCTYGREERCILAFYEGNLRERTYLEDLELDGMISLKWAFNKWDGA